MAGISLPLPGNILHDEPQTLDFDKIATFIGGNGSGKSTILKSIFDEKLKGTMYEDYKIVCFSSGQNESYSNNFSDYLNAERAKRNALNLDCFYYDKLWSTLLIFLATTGKNGLVRVFLRDSGYINENEFEEDESTKLSVKVKVEQGYINRVKQSLEDEMSGEMDVITNKPYHRTLYNFINTLITEDDYEFETVLAQTNIDLDQAILSGVSFEEDQHASYDSKVMFFTQAADKDYFFIKNSFELSFNKDDNKIYLQDISDGEYQLLFLYALIDLFDSDNTLFLFDEADSHLHYRNIEKLWNVYFDIQGTVLTTTHLMDSITKSGLERLSVIDKGKIQEGEKLQYVADRLKDLAEINNTKFKAMSLAQNIVLIDHESDWEYFKLLAIKKLSGTYGEGYIIDKLKKFIVLACPSGHDKESVEGFGTAKINYRDNFVKFMDGYSHITKNIFLICDRDELKHTNFSTEKCTLLVQMSNNPGKLNKGKLTSHLLSWKRREIKHYLLSATALTNSEDELEKINAEFNLGAKSQLAYGYSGDYQPNGTYNVQLASIPSDYVKDLVNQYVHHDDNDNGEYGLCYKKAHEFIDKIPDDEISEDIKIMFDYLVAHNE